MAFNPAGNGDPTPSLGIPFRRFINFSGRNFPKIQLHPEVIPSCSLGAEAPPLRLVFQSGIPGVVVGSWKSPGSWKTPLSRGRESGCAGADPNPDPAAGSRARPQRVPCVTSVSPIKLTVTMTGVCVSLGTRPFPGFLGATFHAQSQLQPHCSRRYSHKIPGTFPSCAPLSCGHPAPPGSCHP